jgi:hypothetical protein
MSSKILIRHFTTKNPVPNPKPDPKPKPDYEPLVVGILISLAAGQLLKIIEYKNKFNLKK